MMRRHVLQLGVGLAVGADQPYDYLAEALNEFAKEYNMLMAEFMEGKNSVNKRGRKISQLWRRVEHTEGWPKD
jgi:hypothetical protein